MTASDTVTVGASSGDHLLALVLVMGLKEREKRWASKARAGPALPANPKAQTSCSLLLFGLPCQHAAAVH